ncbi:MAG: PrsW family intramembrane metalloprotease [Myxococcota bacterium]
MLSILLSVASTVCACVPMFGFLVVVWWLDRYDREPVWLIGLTFLWGATGAVVGAVAVSSVVDGLSGFALHVAGGGFGFDAETAAGMVGPVLVAPLVEEPCKAVFLAYVIWNRHFDNMTDGFVYGAAAGLGFGMTENLMYFVSLSNDMSTWGSTVVVRTFYSAIMHATATAVVGASLGFARFRGCATLGAIGLGGLGLAMVVHGLWNGLITVGEVTGGDLPFMLDLALFPVEVIAVFLVFQVCLWDESVTIRRELLEEADQGRIPREHADILSSWLRRLLSGWVPAGVDHALYVQTATSLAMRKRQVRQMGPLAPEFYRDEVDRLRRQVELLLRVGPPHEDFRGRRGG